MKGFPQTVEGPLGPWYQKVNAAVAKAQAATSADQLRHILGDPDQIDHVEDDAQRESPDAPIDDCEAAEYWVYLDPYRPRFRYQFGISKGRIVERTRFTGPA
jgi:hypothetical protein